MEQKETKYFSTNFTVKFCYVATILLANEMANLIKDIGEIWSRLFDHRPFLNGEIKLFIHEFEEKRGDREVEKLFEILQHFTDIRYSHIDKIISGGFSDLHVLKEKIDKNTAICNSILEDEETFQNDKVLESQRQLQDEEWKVFCEDLAKKYKKIDKIFNEREESLCQSYNNISTIKDSTVRIKVGERLINFLDENLKEINKNEEEVPFNIKNLIKTKKIHVETSDLEWLNQFLINKRNASDVDLLSGKELDKEIEKIINEDYSNFDASEFLEEKNKSLPYLHELMENSEIILPQNEIIKRNPILAERIEKLKKEQEEKEYRAMTQNVNTCKKYIPEDSISYQMKMMNRHLIAVGQFIVSVGAGFAFGFLGLELIVGDLNFGMRLVLGIVCALVIAIAEFYFLAKHLNEEDNEKEDRREKPSTFKVKTKLKLHKD